MPADGGPGDEEPTEEVEEETVPLDNLPKTGESSPIPYYLLGTFFTVSGLMALKRRNRSNP
ncbi:LPXTG cell wall anchor domain-containing protein [Paenibacillus sp. J5C_2022]|uniref:LPXTG cell wall anchor domain-containing protein n=1 Tax=Paenibacillus sp. J5C2022 TaxID=2977129 RepID=UPI0021D0F565|nr:LPXTG cell wall anchor domain-containing protein [Paenibacillus sp. J5C2022]MCU6708452.1 LPXTG cell wall anchor domain-containing protein [Paenibacillus sp. J5C2022]